VSLSRSFAPAATGTPSFLAKAAALLAFPRSDPVCQIVTLEILRKLIERMEMIDGDAEEAVNLRGVKRHRQDPIGARGRQQIGDQAATDRDARRILLVGPRIGVVRDHRRDP